MRNVTLYQLGYSILLIAGVAVARGLVGVVIKHSSGAGRVRHDAAHRRFWVSQLSRLGAIVLFAGGIAFIWANHASSFVAAAGVLTAGVAIALQRVVMAIGSCCPFAMCPACIAAANSRTR